MEKVIFPIINKNLPIYITGVGFNYIQKGLYRENGYQDYQWIQTKEGSGFLEFENEKYQITQGEGFLIPPNIKHSYYPKNDNWIQDWVSFNGEEVLSYYKALLLNKFQIIKFNNNISSSLILRAMKTSRIANSCVKNAATLIDLFCQLSEYSINSHNSLLPILNFINENYTNDITINNLSDILNITPQHFCKIFMIQMNMRPFEYVSTVRITKSKELMLQNQLMKLDEIASLTG